MEQQWNFTEDMGTGNRLLEELAVWNKLAGEIKAAYGEDAMEAKAFCKLKLKEYERLNVRYSNRKDLTRDEKAFLFIHQAKCRELQKLVYPGPFARLLHRVALFLSLSAGKLWKATFPGEAMYEASPNDLLSVPSVTSAPQQPVEQPSQSERNTPVRYGPDLGGRKPQDQGRKSSPTL